MEEVRYSFDPASRIARFTFHSAGPVNTIGAGFLEGLERAQARARRDAAAGILLGSSKKRSFLDGADLIELNRLTTRGGLQALLGRFHRALEELLGFPAPVVATLEGQTALAGGFELLLFACHHVFCTRDCQLGLPEVALGLFPAAGGIQTLRRAIGLEGALEIVLGGKILPPERFARGGLLTVVEPAELAPRAARYLAEHRDQPPRNLDPAWVEPAKADRDQQLARLAEARRRYDLSPCRPQVAAALELFEAGLEREIGATLPLERARFAELFFHPNTRNQLDRFLLATGIGPALVKADPRQVEPVRRIAILGAGLMGQGIAQVSADRGLEVILLDREQALADGALRKIAAGLDPLVQKGRWSAARRDALLGRIRTGADPAALREAPLVIEAVYEDLALKRQILKRAQETNPAILFATNTSALPIEEIAAGASAPENVVGMHYFSPVPLMPLVEIVRGTGTGARALNTAIALAQAQQKTCVVVQSHPGFYTSRMFGAYVLMGFALAERGADPFEVDRLALEVGFPRGPFHMWSSVGGEVVVHAGRFLAERIPDRFAPSASLERVAAAGYTGAGKPGFYRDEAGREPDPKVREHLPPLPGSTPPSAGDVRDALILAMVADAFASWGDGVIGDLTSMDLAAALGVGFPDCWHGPARYVSCQGIGWVVDRLTELHATLGVALLLPPAALLRLRAWGIERGLI